MKQTTKLLLQRLLGYRRYLFLFALFTIRRQKAGRHEKEFSSFLDMIPEEGVILDIGANIGIMTTVLALQRKHATVYAFEPIPENLAVLQRVVRHYGLKNVQVSGTALGDRNGTIEMVRPEIGQVKMQGLSHVVREHDDSAWNTGAVFSVPVRRLDDIPELQHLPKISAVKIDVENFEYYVLHGGMELLRRHMPVIYCELWVDGLRGRCLELMAGLGYTATVHDGGQLVPYAGQDNSNFIFIPPGRS